MVIELKILYQSIEATISDGLKQTAAYMDRYGTADGNLLVFDRSPKTWEEKIFYTKKQIMGKTVRVFGM